MVQINVGPGRSVVVRNSGPIKFCSGPVARKNPGPDHVGPVKWSEFWSEFTDRTKFGPGWRYGRLRELILSEPPRGYISNRSERYLFEH